MENYKKCKVENCENNIYEKEYCCKHYHHINRYGKILERTNRDPNEIIDCGEYCEICLYNRKHEEVGRARIDKEDLEKVKNYKWDLNGRGYVVAYINRKTIGLHQLILGDKEGYEIDHQYGDILDNRKSELRFATRSQNCMNSKAKGYCWDKGMNKWVVYITKNKKTNILGYFVDEQDAIEARKEAEKKYFKEFAYRGDYYYSYNCV